MRIPHAMIAIMLMAMMTTTMQYLSSLAKASSFGLMRIPHAMIAIMLVKMLMTMLVTMQYLSSLAFPESVPIEDSSCNHSDNVDDNGDDDDNAILVKLGQGLISWSKNCEMSGGVVQHWKQA